MPASGRGRLATGLPARGPRVQRLEGDGVPVGQQHLADRLSDGVVADAPRHPRRPGAGHEPAHRVSAIGFHQRDGFEDVAEVLAHLAAILGEDVTQAHDVAVARPVEHEGADRHQGVEPAAGLVDGLADEVGRVVGLQLLRRPGRVRVAPLRERHSPGVEPGVDHLGHATIGGPVADDLDVIDEGTVRVEIAQVTAGQLTQLFQGADTDQVGRIVDVAPDGQRCAPVAAARQRPVDVVVQPVAVAAVLDGRGIPGGGLVLSQQLILDAGGADVPGRLGVVQQRGVAAPAVRVSVKVVEPAEQDPTRLQVGDQGRIGRFEKHPADLRDVVLEMPVGTDGVHERQAVAAAGDHVLLAKGRGLVHQAGAVGGGDVVSQEHVVGGLVELDQLEGPLVSPALQLGAPKHLAPRPLVAQHLVEQRLSDHEGALLGMTADDVVDVGVDGDGGVGDQRPGCGGPHQQVGFAGERPRGDGEPDVDRRVGDVLVALRQLMVGQGGAAARAVGRDPVVLLQEALVEDLLQRPPARLHIAGGHGDVGVVEVDPVPHAAGQLGEGVDVPQHRLAALSVERLHPVGLDVGFTGEAELLLDGQLDGQAVAVPAGLAVDMVALHCLEPREQVLEDAGFDVVRAGHAVGGRRAFVERPGLATGGGVEGLCEGVALSPQRDDLVLQRREIDACGHGVIGTHRYLR